MRVDEIYIISIVEDTMVEQSAQAFFYKYVMRDNTRVWWYDLRNDETFRLRLGYTPAGGFEVPQGEPLNWKSRVEKDLKKKPASTAPSSSGEANAAESNSIDETEATLRYGAIVVAHKHPADKFGSFTPERLAILMADNLDPIFSKISFNVCKAAGASSTKDEELGDWSRHVINPSKQEIAKYKKDNTVSVLKALNDARPQGPKILQVPKQYWDTIDALKTRIEFRPKDSTQINDIYDGRNFNTIVRFLHKYVRQKNTPQKVLVAGYDEGLTAAHPDKKERMPTAKPFLNSYIGRRITDSGAFMSDNPRHKFCFVAANGKNGLVARIELSGWTDRI